VYRQLARWCFSRSWTVVALWVAAVFGFGVLGATLGTGLEGEFEPPASESARGFATVSEYFPGAASSFGGSIVFETDSGVDDPTVVQAMSTLFEQVDDLEHVSVVSPYSQFGAGNVAPERTVAFADVNLDSKIDQRTAAEIGATITGLLPTVDGLRIELGGRAFADFEPPNSELIGLAFAIVVLIVAFGSVLAMGLPIGVALAGVGTGAFGVVALLTRVFSIPEFAPMIGIMVGLGVGIDYALFIVTRYRELTAEGIEPEEAVMRAMDTSGRAVVFAGLTVVVSLLGMLLMGLPFIAGLGIAAAATVGVTLVASMTLLPAMISLTRDRIETTRWRGLLTAGFISLALLGLGFQVRPVAIAGAGLAVATIVLSFLVPALRREVPTSPRKPLRQTLSYRWSRLIQARPWTFVIVGCTILGAMAMPVFGLQLGFSDEGNLPEDTTTRAAYDIVAEGFGPGFNGPFIVAVELGDRASVEDLEGLTAAISADPGVVAVSAPMPNDPDRPTAAILRVTPATAPQDAATSATVKRLRESVVGPIATELGIEANVTGAVPTDVDFTNYLAGRIPIFFGAVLGVSFLLLMMVFRSLLVPVKAVIMNVLSIAAAYGIIVAIFQWGWFGSLTGVEPAPIEPFIPMMLFAIVFGLSMDYEVFLLSRMKEEYERTGDPAASVADGLAATGKVITAAAAIMVVVFGSFLLEDNRIIKMFGAGLGLAVLIDATLVRMLLVPATMELLGKWNWWLPKWLEAILPELSVEGPKKQSSPQPRHARDAETSPLGDLPAFHRELDRIRETADV
jgi:putative drug exporter of the RND superfamily